MKYTATVLGYVSPHYAKIVEYGFGHCPTRKEIEHVAMARFLHIQDVRVVSAHGELVQDWQNRESEEILKAERNTSRGLNLDGEFV